MLAANIDVLQLIPQLNAFLRDPQYLNNEIQVWVVPQDHVSRKLTLFLCPAIDDVKISVATNYLWKESWQSCPAMFIIAGQPLVTARPIVLYC